MRQLDVIGSGPDTVVLSGLCARCPYSAGGCCVAPPRYDLSDVARVVAHGGRDWLLAQLAAKRIRQAEGGYWLTLARPKRPLGEGCPREAACVFLTSSGCSIAHEQKPATCNYYVCDAAVAEDAAQAPTRREAHERLVQFFVTLDAKLHEQVTNHWGDAFAFDAPHLDWLAEQYREQVAAFRGI